MNVGKEKLIVKSDREEGMADTSGSHHGVFVALATVPDHHVGSGSRSNPNRCQIGCLGGRCTQFVHSGTVQWTTPNPSGM